MTRKSPLISAIAIGFLIHLGSAIGSSLSAMEFLPEASMANITGMADEPTGGVCYGQCAVVDGGGQCTTSFTPGSDKDCIQRWLDPCTVKLGEDSSIPFPQSVCEDPGTTYETIKKQNKNAACGRHLDATKKCRTENADACIVAQEWECYDTEQVVGQNCRVCGARKTSNTTDYGTRTMPTDTTDYCP